MVLLSRNPGRHEAPSTGRHRAPTRGGRKVKEGAHEISGVAVAVGRQAVSPHERRGDRLSNWWLSRVRDREIDEDRVFGEVDELRTYIQQKGARLTLGPEMRGLLSSLRVPIEEGETWAAFRTAPDGSSELLVSARLRDVERAPYMQYDVYMSARNIGPDDLSQLGPQHLDPFVRVRDKLGSGQYYAWVARINPPMHDRNHIR